MTEGRLSLLGRKLAVGGPLWAGSVCWSSGWACLLTDGWQWGRQRQTGRRDSPASPMGPESAERRGRRKSQVVWGHSEEMAFTKEEWERETQMARKRVTERRRESCHSLSLSCAPAPFPSARLAVLATPCSGGERLLKPCPGLHVWTQLLLLPH